MPDRPEGGFNRIRGAQALPMGSRKRVEAQQFIAIFLQTRRGLRILGLIGLQKEVERVCRIRVRLRPPDLVQGLFRLGLNTFRQGI